MSKRILITVISSQTNSEAEQQLITAAQRRGHEVIQSNGNKTLLFIPDLASKLDDKQSLRGTLIEVHNQAANYTRQTGRKALADLLNNTEVLLNYIESKVSHSACKPITESKQKETTTSDGVDWETLNALPHMQQLTEI